MVWRGSFAPRSAGIVHLYSISRVYELICQDEGSWSQRGPFQFHWSRLGGDGGSRVDSDEVKLLCIGLVAPSLTLLILVRHLSPA